MYCVWRIHTTLTLWWAFMPIYAPCETGIKMILSWWAYWSYVGTVYVWSAENICTRAANKTEGKLPRMYPSILIELELNLYENLYLCTQNTIIQIAQNISQKCKKNLKTSKMSLFYYNYYVLFKEYLKYYKISNIASLSTSIVHVLGCCRRVGFWQQIVLCFCVLPHCSLKDLRALERFINLIRIFQYFYNFKETWN